MGSEEWVVPLFASGRDSLVHDTKSECTNRVVESRLPTTRAKAFRAAIPKLVQAMLKVEPLPPHGSMWATVIEADADEVRDAVLLPEDAAVGGEDAALNYELESARDHIVALDAKLRTFRATRDSQAPVIGEAICAIARARGTPLQAAQSLARVRAAITRQLTGWLAAKPWTVREAWK